MNPDDFAINNCALTIELLDKYPVWTEWEDDPDMVVPVFAPAPFETDFNTLTLRADYTTPMGRKLKGCVLFSSTFERVYAIEIFVASEGITFNRNLASLVPLQVTRLQDVLCDNVDPIFPLAFSTDVSRNGIPFVGSFDPRRDDNHDR